MSRAGRLVGGGAIALAIGTMALAGLWWFQPAPPAAAPSASPIATAEVTRGMLVDTKTVTGTLSYGQMSSLGPGSTAASAMLTWLATVGATVERGQPLYALDGEPVILFYGSLPQHRTLRFDVGAPAPLWVELEQAAAAAKTAELTLELNQERLADAEARASDTASRLDDALAPAPATAEFIQLVGAVSAAEARLGRVTKLAAANHAPAVEVAVAEGELVTARASLNAAIRALHRDLASAGLDAATARVAVAEAEAKRDALRAEHENLAERVTSDADVRQLAENLAALGYEGPLFEQVRAWQRDAGLSVTGIVGPRNLVVAPGPVHVAAHRVSVGETRGPPDGSAILDYSSTERLVTVPLNVGDQGLAAVGRAVTVTLPDARKVEGTITEVGSVVTGGTIEVTVTMADQATLGDPVRSTGDDHDPRA